MFSLLAARKSPTKPRLPFGFSSVQILRRPFAGRLRRSARFLTGQLSVYTLKRVPDPGTRFSHDFLCALGSFFSFLWFLRAPRSCTVTQYRSTGTDTFLLFFRLGKRVKVTRADVPDRNSRVFEESNRREETKDTHLIREESVYHFERTERPPSVTRVFLRSCRESFANTGASPRLPT